MAQAIGAYAGIVRRQSGQPIEIGLLLGTRRYHCALAYFAPGTQLTVRAEQLVHDAGGVAAFACSIHVAGRELARAEIKAFQPDDRSEEHTSELQSLMRISYAGLCVKKKNNNNKDKPDN